MAVEQTQVLPAPVLEGALTAFTKKLTPLIGQQIDTTKFDPQVAAQTQLQKDASAAAAGLGSLVGPQAFQPFMSPYQQEVIDTTLAEFDRQQAIQQTGLRDAAISAGAFGGARQGIQATEAANQAALGRAGLQAQLLQQGFQQAQAGALGNLQAQQGLGQYQASLGGQERGIDQAMKTADAQEAREMQLEPFTRLGLVAPQLASVIGGFPAQTIQTSTPPPSFAQPRSEVLSCREGMSGSPC